jgi:hypothetical protein
MDSSLAIEFNNLGAHFLREGHRSEAMILFKGASQLMTLILSQGSNSTASVSAHEDPRIARAHLIYSKYNFLKDSASSLYESRSAGGENPNINSSRSFVYQEALTLSEDDFPREEDLKITLSCSAILYNVALVFHLDAIDTVLETSGQRALKLYEMAFELLYIESILKLESTLKLRVIMYCLNNMASLNHELTHWERSAQCLKRLVSIATIIQARGAGSALQAECQTFLLNALALKRPNRAPAA